MAAILRAILFTGVLLSVLWTAVVPTVVGDESSHISSKALKYHEVLRKRPEPGYLYDRFYNTWLDEATVNDLQKFLSAQANDSKDTADLLLLAFFYAKQGDDSAALEEFRRALADNPGSAEAWYQKAAVEARTLDFETAIADLRKAQDQKPDEKLAVQIDKQLGRLLVRNRQTDEAAKVWGDLLAANPGDDELAGDLLELHIDEGLFEQAAKLAEALLARTKDPYLAVTRRLRLGDVHQRAGNREKALEAYGAALDDVGQDSWLEQEILAQTEQLFRREDNLTQLRQHYQELLQSHPKRIAVHRRYAKLLVELDEHDPAMAAYKTILELTPGDRANREEYVEVLAKIGKQDQAVEQLRTLCDQHPQDAELRFRLAALLNEAGKKPQSVAAVREYIVASDKSEYAYLRAARALERFEQKDAAAEAYRELSLAMPDSPSAQEAYAGFLYSNDQKEEALAIYRKLGEGAELSELLHVARALSARDEHDAALELLGAREADFAREPLYFSQLAATALATKKPELAVPWTRRRVELAENASDLEAALDQAILACDRADQVESTAKELAALPQRSIQQTCLLAELQEAAGDSRAADELLAGAAAGGDLMAVSEQIRLYNQRRDWTAAAEATRRLLELPGGRKSIHVRRLVELCQRDFQIEEALRWIDQWKRLSPGSTSPWVTEANLLRMQGKDDEAIAVIKSAVQKFDEDEDLRVRLAQLYAESNHLGDAERIYWQLYDDTEDVAGKLRWAQELAKIGEQQGKLTQLVENFEERRRSNRTSIVPLLSLAEVYRESDNYEGRRQALTAAAKIKPDDLELLHHIARVEEQEGDWNAAIETLERASQHDKTNRTKERIARLHLNYGNADDGFAILFELAGADEGDPRTLEAIGDAMCGLGEWERAAGFLAPRVAEHPGDYRLRYLLAVAQEETGDTVEALSQFLALLNDQEELPDVAKKNVPPAATNSYFDMIRTMAPPAVVECIELAQYRYTAYQHQRNGSVRTSISGAGGPQGNIQMPMRVELARPMALAHIVTLAQMLEDDESKDLVRLLQQHGVKSGELLIRLGPEGYYQAANGEFEQYLEEHPEDDVGLALVVLRQFSRQQPDMAKYAEKAIVRFEKQYPELALLAAVQAGVAEEVEKSYEADEESHAAPVEGKINRHFDTALQIAADIESPSPMTVIGMAQAIGGQPYSQQDAPAVPQAYRNKFSKLILAWYPALRQSPQYGQWAFMYVVGTLASGDDATQFITFLEDEVARHDEGGKGRQQSQQAMHYSQQPQLLAPLTFPPIALADFPASVLSLLRSPDEASDPYASAYGRASNYEFDLEKAKPLIEKVRRPVLRLLLARRFELNELADKTLQEMLAAEQPQLDAYLLAAGKAMVDEQPTEAVELLSKARYLPMDREMRARVDASIVVAVTEAKDDPAVAKDESLKKQLVEAGQAACLRLRQSRMDANKRSELIAAMEDLGLKREAEKLDKLASTQTTSSTAAAVVYSPASASPGSQDRAAKLVAEGKRDAAVKLLSAEVLGQARQVLANPQNASYMRYQARQIKQRVDALGLSEELLTSIDPGNSENSQRLSEYAVVCEMFDRKEIARQAYERLIAKRPKDDALRVRLLMLLEPTELESAQDHLKQLNPAQSMTIGQMLVEQLQNYELDVDVRINRAELALKYLQTLRGEERAQTGWSNALIQILAHQLHTRQGRNLPSLYLKTDAEEQKLSEQQQKQQQRRAAVHQALCEEMLRHADSARPGFTHLLALAEARGENLEGFIEQATKVLRDEAEARPQLTHNPYANYSYSSGQPNLVRLQTPEEFLVRQSAAANDWTLIEDELLPALSRGRSRNVAKALQQMMQLYRCPPEGFLAVAEETMQRRPAINVQDEGEDLAIVVAAWSDRELEADLQPLLIERLKRMAKSQNHHQTPECVSQFVEATSRRRGAPAALALLEQITEIYLGPAEKREDFLAKNSSNNNITWGQPTGQIYVYKNFMSQLLQRQSLSLIVLAYLQGLDGASVVNNLSHYAQSSITALLKQPTDSMLDALTDSPWLADLETFHPLTVGAGDYTGSWLGYFLKTAGGETEKDKQELAAAIAKRYEAAPTFGLGLIDAQLGGGEQLLAYISEHLQKIRQLEGERQWGISDLVASLAREELDKPEAAEKYAEIKKWLQGGAAEAAEQLVQNILNAKRLEELTSEPWNAGEFLAGALGDRVAEDPQLVADAFFHFVDLAHDAQKRNQWNFYYGESHSTAAYLLRGLAQRTSRDNLGRIPLVIAIIDNNHDQHVEYSGDNYGIEEALRQYLDKPRSGRQQPPQTIVHAVQNLHRAIGEAVGDRSSSLLVNSYYNVFNQRFSDRKNRPHLAELLNWAKAASSQELYPRLAEDFAAALAMVQSEQAKNDKKGEFAEVDRAALQQIYREYFRQQLDDAELPVAWRMHLASTLARYEGDELPTPLGEKLSAVFVEAIDSGVAIPADQQRRLVEWLAERAAAGEALESANVWQEKWAKRYLRPASTNRSNQFEKLDEIGDSSVLGPALRLYLQLDDQQRVNLLLRRYDANLRHDPRIIALLLRDGDATHAAGFLRSHWTELSLNWPETEATHYDASIVEEESALCEQLSRDGEKFFARAFLAAMPDPKPKADAASSEQPAGDEIEKADAHRPQEPTPRDLRLQKLAEEFPSVNFSDDGMRSRALVLLSNSRPASELLRDAVAEQYQKLNLALVLPQNNSQQWTMQAELAQCHLRNEFRRGKTEPFVELFDSLAKLVDDQNYEASQRIHHILQCCKDAMVEDCSAWSPEQHKALGASLRSLLVGKEYLWLNDFSAYNSMIIVTHVRGGAVDELRDWHKKLSNNLRSNVDNRGLNRQAWGMLQTSLGEPTDDNRPARLKAMEAMVACLAELNWLKFHHNEPHHVSGYPRNQSIYKHVIDSKLLSREELLAYAAQTDPLPERHFMVHLTLAEWLAAEQNYEPAARLYEASIEKMPSGWKLRRIHWKLNAASAWANAGDLEKARKLGEEAMALEGVRDAERTKHQRLTQLIEKLASENTGDGGPADDQKAAAAPAAEQDADKNPQAALQIPSYSTRNLDEITSAAAI